MNKPDKISTVFVIFISLVGLIVRIAVPLSSPFPLNDGGLFYNMILDVQTHQYVLPQVTTYNNASIPFAYPPLAFYVYAVLNALTHIPLLNLTKLLPGIISALSIPAFYLLAKEVLESKTEVALATALFAMLPRDFDWLIMGGGITRSLGLLFALLAMRQAYFLYTKKTPGNIIPMIGWGALVVFTHPEATTHTILTAIIFFLWKDRSRKGIFYSLLVAVGILLVTAPWWVTVLMRYGISPYIAAANAARQDSYSILIGIFALFGFDFTDEPFVTLIAVLAIIGIFYLIAKKKYILPAWLAILHLIEPRGGALFMTIPMAMTAGIAVDQVILPYLRRSNKEILQNLETTIDNHSNWLDQLLQGGLAKIFIGFVFVYGVMSAYDIAWKIKQDYTLSDADLQAFSWVDNNTPIDSRFALITGAVPLRDASSEWFPALTGRQSVATVFGFEWVNDGLFGKRTDEFRALQSCADQNIDCLDAWTQESGKSFSYVYLHTPSGNIVTDLPLAVFLRNSAAYELVYDSKEIEIFRKK